ncbi:response regulator transcription factor [uncultured Novosphingobium sp.]|uniref:response regulator transcription factor n=1 Tax=Novosphingobium fluoreni TaxID=1391222 RepID=UPI0007370D1E|nr:response regulator transcription factor [uncultured Novosphingobium sp.]KTR83307.1 PhoB family transcriptional regulator [Novosphingobium barchaimii]
MQRIDILLTGDLAGGFAPFRHGDLELVLHRWSSVGQLPLIEGALWAFVDWVLPEMSGLELVRRLRCDPATATAHITIVLEEDDQDDRKRALRTGADDYMVGPLTRTALLDRVLATHVVEPVEANGRKVSLGDLTIDISAFQARWHGKAISLMPNEFRLLRYFIEHPGRVFTRAQLISALGKQEPPIDERTVDVWIGRLRRALKAAGAGNPLRTVRSLGYVFDEI